METNQNKGFGGAGAEAGYAGGSPDMQDTMDSTKEKAREAASQAQQKLGEQLRSSVDTSKGRAADTLDSLAQALSQSGQQLRSDDLGPASQYVDRAGEQLRRASDYLRNTNVDEMVRNTEDFARRQPAVFVGGAFFLGLLAARFIKASQAPSYGSIPRDRSLVTQEQGSVWRGDRETAVSGYREPSTGGTAFDTDTDPTYTREFGRDVL
jgi:ElaB/YqjD/DUF883 family membrane-anchored ribosome-binding protein